MTTEFTPDVDPLGLAKYGADTGFAQYTPEMLSLDVDVKLILSSEAARLRLMDRIARAPLDQEIDIIGTTLPTQDGKAIECDLETHVQTLMMELLTDTADIHAVLTAMGEMPKLRFIAKYGTYKQDLINGEFLKKGEDY